jgi:hypothetical protein
VSGRGDVLSASGSAVFVAAVATTLVAVRAPFDGATALFDNISVREINPLALSIQMDGRVTYADTGSFNTVVHMRWQVAANNRLEVNYATNVSANTRLFALQDAPDGTNYDGVLNNVSTPSILSPFNVATRFTSTAANLAANGTAGTANTSLTALPNLSAANLQLGQTYNGTIRTFRMWGQDIGDTGLVEATEPSLVPSLSLTFDGTENSFIVNDWSE